MADLDSLIVTFQTQLSDVMETVVKTAMYEVTRLVEDGFLEEVKRRDQEVESLRVQLQWAERKLSDHGGKDRLEMTGMCVERVGDEVELSSAEERPEGHQEDIFRGCGLKAEGERWTRSLREGATPRSDGPVAAHSPESQATAEEDALAAVDVKEEEGDKPSCSSVRLGGWSGEARPESQSNTAITEAQPGQTQESSEELLRNIIKQDPQLTAAYVFPEEQEETHMAKDLPLEEDSGWVGLTATTAGVLLATETDCDPAQTRGSARQTEHELSSITSDVSALVAAGREQSSSSASPKVRLQNSDALNVTIKQEVITDSDRCEKNTYKDKKVTKSGVASFSSSVKQHRMSSETLKQNRISHKAAVQEVMKLHSKVGAGLRLQADIQHLHRPMKRFSQALANSATTAQSIAHSQVVNLNPLNRVPSTSKATAPPLSAQRLHLGDKQATAHSRSGAPWVSIKTQLHSANSHHASPLPHPDSHAHAGPRHLLRCGQCGKCFPHPSNLKAHLQTHTGERPFCCSLCGRSFTKLSNLKAHRRVHTGERPYCCLACGKRFTQKCNLKRHQRIHLDV